MTNSSFSPLMLVTALVSGAVTGALVAAWMVPSAPSTDASLALVSENAALSRRIDALEQRFDAFSDQVASWKDDVVPIEPLAFGSDVPTVDGDAPGVSAGKDEIAAAGAAFEEPEVDLFEPTAALKDSVAAALEEIRRDEKVAGWRDSVQNKRDRLDASMDYLTDNLELNDYQTAELRRALTAQYDREDALIDMWDRGVADDLVGRQKESDYQMFTDAIASFLSEDQNTGFWEIVQRYSQGGKGG